MKGMRKIKRGNGFRGATSYTIYRDPGDEPGQIIGGNMSGSTPRELAKEFSASRKLRPDIKKPVWHNALRLPQGENLEPVRLVEIADDYMQRMGFTNLHQRLYVMHDDPDGQHVHIIASRVSIDGSVYLGRNENLESTRHIQALERAHGLTKTKGPTLVDGKVVMPERRRMKKGEIEMAFNKSGVAPRCVLQNLIDNALRVPCTAPDFVEKLERVGVRAKPNIAESGTMNGFSFEFQGIAFKGSELGNGYKWKILQEKGVEYVKDRDSENLIKRKERPSKFTEHKPGYDQTIRVIARGDIKINRANDCDRNREEIPENNGFPANGDRKLFRTNSNKDHPKMGQLVGSNLQVDFESRKNTGPVTGIGRRDRENNNRDERNGIQTQQNTAQIIRNNSSIDLIGAIERPVSRAWDSDFRADSAAQRCAKKQRHAVGAVEQIDTGAARIDASDIKQISPVKYLLSQGFLVKREGWHHSVVDLQGDERYRLTEKPNGHWLWCDHYGNQGSDCLDLVKEIEPTLSYFERILRLTGSSVIDQGNRQKLKLRHVNRPILPVQTELVKVQGQAYLQKRGISISIIKEAEQQGFLKYCSDGILFCGYDQMNKEIASVTKRATYSNLEVQKKDLWGSDNSQPAILKGSSKTLWFVKGGADALALHDIAKRQRQKSPMVVVTGGARIYSCLKNEYIQMLTSKCSTVIMAYENEDSPLKQIKTDAGHDRQREIIKKLTGRDVQVWRSSGARDLAELNALQMKEERTRRYDDLDPIYGMSL
jgi:hypothetical protein